MKRPALFLIAVAAVLSLPATAAAFRGVAVAKDTARHSVVIASRDGIVRTVRAPGQAATIRLGRRLVVSARRLSDGTYRAGSLRVAGHARRALIRGVVVRNQRRLHRLILSAGGSVFAVRTGHGFESKRSGPGPGDRLEVRVVISPRGLRAATLEDLGHDGTLELEGIFLGLTGDGNIRLAVVHRGEVFVAIPAGFKLPSLKPGDKIELHVLVDASGAFTLVRIENEDNDENEDRGRVEVRGKISALSAESITVDRRHRSPVTCAVPKGVVLSSFEVGDFVEMKCVRVRGELTLKRLESEDDHDDGDDQSGHGGGGGGDDGGGHHGGHGG